MKKETKKQNQVWLHEPVSPASGGGDRLIQELTNQASS